MPALVVDVMDRLFAINSTIVGMYPSRYFPPDVDGAVMPTVYALPKARRNSTLNAGSSLRYEDRIYEICVILGAWSEGIPIQTAQARGEILIDTILNTYAAAPRLELAGVPLSSIVMTRLLEDTGIVLHREYTTHYALYFSLIVTDVARSNCF